MESMLQQMMAKMNVTDGNLAKDSGDVLQQLEFARARAKDESSKPPIPVPCRSPEDLRFSLTLQRNQFDMAASKPCMLRQTYMGEDRTRSDTPLNLLKPIRLQEMNIRQHHKGKYLLCRVISPPSKVVCVMVGVEDQNGWAYLLSIYNFPHTEVIRGEELDALFPINTVIAIREPHPKMAFTGPSSHIRVDSPSDIVFLDLNDPLVKDAVWSTGGRPLPATVKTDVEWKAIGNRHFKENRFMGAVVAYSFAIRRDPSVPALRLNRALAYIRLGSYVRAFHDAVSILDFPGVDKEIKLKALYRAGVASYGQGDYEGAREWYQKCLMEESTMIEGKVGLNKCDDRLRERNTGQYDWVALHKQSLSFPARPDAADYTGSIQVTSIASRGGGRGVIATKDIKIGELIVVSKAFASAFKEDSPNDITQALNFHTGMRELSTQYSMVQRTICRLFDSPSSAQDLYDLYAGPELPKYSENPPPSFPTPLDHPLKFNCDVDTPRIEAIASIDSFHITSQAISMQLAQDDDPPSGLFILPSYFNHSCMANTSWYCYGDVLVIRAAQNINAGEEVMLQYTASESYQTRQQHLKKHFDQCDCPMCQADRVDGPTQRTARERLLATVNPMGMSIPSAKRLVTALQKTYDRERTAPRVGLAEAHHHLGHALEKAALFSNGNAQMNLRRGAIREQIASLEAYGALVLDKGIEDLPSARRPLIDIPLDTNLMPQNLNACSMACFMIMLSFHLMGIRWRARRWMHGLLWIENAHFGGGIQLFRARYVDLLKSYGPTLQSLLDDIEQSGWKP